MVDKSALLALLRERIATELATAIETQKEAQAAAVHSEAKAEGDKDTRATETSYLARGLAMRVAELTRASTLLDAMHLEGDRDSIAVGSLVEVSDADSGERSAYFIAPAGAGEVLEIEGISVAVITPKAPLCRALLGKRQDDDVEFKAPRGTRELVIEAIS